MADKQVLCPVDSASHKVMPLSGLNTGPKANKKLRLLAPPCEPKLQLGYPIWVWGMAVIILVVAAVVIYLITQSILVTLIGTALLGGIVFTIMSNKEKEGDLKARMLFEAQKERYDILVVRYKRMWYCRAHGWIIDPKSGKSCKADQFKTFFDNA